MSLYAATLLDSFLVVTCAILLWKYARVSALHSDSFTYVIGCALNCREL